MNYTVLNSLYTLIEHSECTENHRWTKTDLCSYRNRTFKQSSFTSMLFILEHNTSIMGSLKSIIGKNFGNIPKAFWATF